MFNRAAVPFCTAVRSAVLRENKSLARRAFASVPAAEPGVDPCASLPWPPSEAALNSFNDDGFLVVPSVLSPACIARVNAGIDSCFAFNFTAASGTYPDEIYWRRELAKPGVTRHGTQFWKSNADVATVALSERLGAFASALMGWGSNGCRLGNDSIWVKPPSAGTEVAFHSDLWYIPTSTAITCWVALTDVSTENGTLEYVRGSHKWTLGGAIPRDEFHAEGRDYRETAYAIAGRNGVRKEDVDFKAAVAPAGSIVFHHGNMLHGSDCNRNAVAWRRSMGVHLIPAESRHGPKDGYIYGRYKLFGDDTMQETFFPITWTPSGHRSPVIAAHLAGREW